MRTTFVRYDLRKVKSLLRVIYFLGISVFFGVINLQAQTTRVWNGAGVLGGTGDTKLDVAANWSPAGQPTILDSCVMNFSTTTGTFTLSISNASASLSMKALTINLTGAPSPAVVLKPTININKPLTINGSLTINNSSSSSFNDEINFSISGSGTVVCNGTTAVAASGKGAITIQNNTSFILNGRTTFSNSGSMPVKFLVANNSTATTTVNANVIFGTTLMGQWTNNLSNTILIGSTSATSTATFVFNGDSIVLGYNMGTERFNSGTMLFNGTAKQVVGSYAKIAPDRIPGTLKFGGGVNLSQVYYEKLGGDENDALVVRNALIVNDSCLFSVRAVVVPSSGTLVSPDGLIQVKSGATLVLGTKSGTSSSLPETYKTYSFHPTSTIIFDGNSRQVIYEGADYGNVEISGADTAVKTSGGSINILGNLIIRSGKTFAASDSANKTITIKGNWTNGGTFIPKTSTVSFDSSTNVTIGGSTNTDFFNLRINKPSGGSVTLNKDVTVSDTLTLTEGELKLNVNKLTLNGKIAAAGTGTLTGSSASSLYIGGTGSLGTLNFTGGAQTLGDLTINRSASGLAIMGTDLSVGTTTNFTNGAFAINGNTLTLNGVVNTTSGTLTGSTTSNLVIGGTANNLFFTPNDFINNNTTNNYLKTLELKASATATLGDSLNIAGGSFLTGYGTVTVLINGVLNAGGKLTFKSNLLGTARVNFSLGKILGNVTVERHIPPRRAWRFLSVPVNNDTLTIRSAWQEGVNNPDLSTYINPHPGFGTQITGDNDITKGFDYNTTVNPSLKVWDVNTNNWSTTQPPTVSTLIKDFPAYCLFVRGSRAVELWRGTSAPTDNTVLRTTGTLNETGAGINKTFTGGAAGNFILVGNPFVSSLDLLPVLARSSNIVDKQFWVWDPKLSTSGNNVGGYVTYNNGIMAPSSGSYPVATSIMHSGQAFMVKLIAANATLGFEQGDKQSVEQFEIFGLQAQKKQPAAPPVIYTNLLTASGSELILVDGVAAGFGRKFSAGVDYDDADKLWNFDENMALVRNDKALAIEMRPIPVQTDTLFYRLYLRQQPYTLQILSQNLPANLPGQAWLVDKYLNTQTEINLHDTTLYSFAPNKDTISYRNRFMLVFNRSKDVIATKGTIEQVATGSEQTAGIYPNPVTGNSFNLVLSGLKKDKYMVNIYSNTGNLISTRNIEHGNSNGTYNFKLPVNTITGNYTVQVLGRRGEVVRSIPLIISK